MTTQNCSELRLLSPKSLFLLEARIRDSRSIWPVIFARHQPVAPYGTRSETRQYNRHFLAESAPNTITILNKQLYLVYKLHFTKLPVEFVIKRTESNYRWCIKVLCTTQSQAGSISCSRRPVHKRTRRLYSGRPGENTKHSQLWVSTRRFPRPKTRF